MNNPDTLAEQAQKIIELGKLKAELSTSFRALEQYHQLIEKLLQPTELLDEEECQVVLSKEFSKAVSGFAQASSKVRQWHEVNNPEETIAFLLPRVTESPTKRDFDVRLVSESTTN